MDFSSAQHNMSKADQAPQPHKPSSWMRPFSINRGYSAPMVPTSIQFNGVSIRSEQQFHMPQQFNGGQLPKQHFVEQHFPSQHFIGQQFPEQEIRQETFNDRPFPSQHFLNSNVYADVIHSHQNATLAIQSQEYSDRNEAKPRLAKGEVELLEKHFKENHKPPSSLKRQLAEGMNVQVARINVSHHDFSPFLRTNSAPELVPKSPCEGKAREKTRNQEIGRASCRERVF